MEAPQPSKNHAGIKGVIQSTAWVAAFFTAYEFAKERLFPGLSHWGSHVITIAVATTLAALASIYVNRRQRRVVDALRTNESELRKAEAVRAKLVEQLRDAVRLRDDFLSVASHELKTPLTALRIQIQYFHHAAQNGSLQKIPAETLVKFTSISKRQLERLIDLVDDLLDVSRISTGHLKLRLTKCDLCEVVRQAQGRLVNELTAPDRQIRLSMPDCPVYGTWDRSRIEQVIVNLVSNAFKYGGGKPVDVVLTWSDEKAFLLVRDQGMGIAPKDQARIFERFERAVPPGQAGGLGLGLFICRQIVESLQGTIRVESELGKGSTFIVELPLNVAQNDQVPRAA